MRCTRASTRGFLEYARHRGFITDPARVRRPRDKPRVERSVPYVRERFFKGALFRDLAEMRAAARRWCLEVAGQRIHGTTRRQPIEVFQEEERPLLVPWDGEPYEVPDWRTATVHADHYVACQYALYTMPSALCPPGQRRSSSFVITSNRTVEEWLGLFDDPILGNSALDRLANAGYQIVIEGESYRQRLSPHRALLEGREGGD